MTDRPQTFAEALCDLGRGITDALSQAATETTFTNAATRALTACLDQDDQHAAELLQELTDAQLYAIEGAASGLAIHASRLRAPADEREASESSNPIRGTTGAEFGDACRAYGRAVRRAFPPTTAPDATAALRDDLARALDPYTAGDPARLADAALRAVEPALLAVEVDTAQRMQDDVDHWRARAEHAEAQIARTLRALDPCSDVKVRDIAAGLRNILTGKDTQRPDRMSP